MKPRAAPRAVPRAVDVNPGATTILIGPWRADVVLIAVPALAIFAFTLFSQTVFSDGDTNWQVAAGRWMIAHHAVPAGDPFSFTVPGRRWVTHEWLSEVLLGLAFAAAGWSGVVILTGAAASAALALMAAELRRWLDRLSVIAALGMAITLLLVSILVRPHVIALPVLVLWTVELMKARRLGRTPALWLLPLMAVWANLHGSYIFGLAFTAFFALEAVCAADAKGRRVRVALGWGAFGLAAAVLTLATPNGLAGATFPFEVLTMKDLPYINEWVAANFAKPSTLEFVLMFTLFICLYRGVKIPAVRLALLLVLLHMTLVHIRQEIILAVIAPLLLAEPLGRALGARQDPAPSASRPTSRQIFAFADLFLAGFVGLAVVRLVMPVTRADQALTPVTALDHVPVALRAKPVFNDYSFGGWLIFNGVKPYIDGRADMYGDDFLKQYLYATGGAPGPIATAFNRYKIAWTILQPAAPLVAKLDVTPGWRRLYADKYAVVQVRNDAWPAPAK